MTPAIGFQVAVDETDHLIGPAECQILRNNQLCIGVWASMRGINSIAETREFYHETTVEMYWPETGWD